MFTGGDYEESDQDEIYKWNDNKQKWVEKARMIRKRDDHALSIVNMDDLMDYCN